MLTLVLQSNNIDVKQDVGYADILILRTALEKSAELQPTIVSQGLIPRHPVYILIIMIALASEEKLKLLLNPKIRRVRIQIYHSKNLQPQHPNVENYILLAHGCDIGGCDTTSAIHRKEKKSFEVVSN